LMKGLFQLTQLPLVAMQNYLTKQARIRLNLISAYCFSML
jgi:hypothetical protein